MDRSCVELRVRASRWIPASKASRKPLQPAPKGELKGGRQWWQKLLWDDQDDPQALVTTLGHPVRHFFEHRFHDSSDMGM